MRELDLLLAGFLSAGLDELADDDLDRFEALLEHPDQDILAWLVSEEGPGDPDLRSIVARIRCTIVQAGGSS
jgi:antitoxin CptB